MMRSFGLAEIAAATGARLDDAAAGVRVSGVSTDSRAVGAGELFVALRGERHDAHEFVADAVRRGAAAVLASRPVQAAVPVLLAADTLLALGEVAALNRSQFAGPVVGLTGSAGKTTTKDMLAAVLGAIGPVHATRGNQNNEVGVPLTLLGLAPEHRAAVVEMGAGKPGDIAILARIARPTVAMVTNAMAAHLERLVTLDEVARTKGAIFEELPAAGVAIVNADDAYADYWLRLAGARRVLRFSVGGRSGAEVRASGTRLEAGCAVFRLELPGEAAEVRLALPGPHQVANALAAAAAAHALGVDAQSIAARLAGVGAAPGRMQRQRGANGCVLIDDTYNANPGSVRAAIDTLASCAGTRVLALGNMAELGEQAAALHVEVAAYARERGIERLLATGPHAAAMAAAFGAGAEAFPTRDALARVLRGLDAEGVVVLVKGSRSAGMEAVVADVAGATPGAARTGTH